MTKTTNKEIEETREMVKMNTVERGKSIKEEDWLMRLAGYLSAVGMSTKKISEAIDITPEWYRKRYRSHPKVIAYREQYEQRLAVELEADFGRVVKEVKSMAFSKVANVRAGDKLGALKLLSDLYGKTPPQRVELTGEGGGPIGVAAYRELSSEELKERIAERTRTLASVKQG